MKLILKACIVFGVCFSLSCCDYIKSFNNEFRKGKESAYYWSILTDFKDWAIAFDHYYKTNNAYPETNDIEQLKKMLIPFHSEDIPLRTIDPWENSYIANSNKDQYQISFIGNDNDGSHEYGTALHIESYESSVTMQNGIYRQYLKSWSDLVIEYEKEIFTAKTAKDNSTIISN